MDNKPARNKEPYYIVQSVDRALDILQLFLDVRQPMGVSEIAKRMALHKSIVHRLLATLQSRGYLKQTGGSEQYMIGPKAFEIGSLFTASTNLHDMGKQVLDQLVQDVKLTSHLAILEGKSVLYLLNMEPEHLQYLFGSVGQRKQIYNTALGKCLTAWLPEEKTRALLADCAFECKTDNTIRSLGQFLQELATVRKLGYAVDNEEAVLGARCFGAPVRDQTGAVAAAISVSGYGDDVNVSRTEELGLKVKRYADILSRRIGYYGE